MADKSEDLFAKLHTCGDCNVVRSLQETVDLSHAKWQFWVCDQCGSEQHERFSYRTSGNPDYVVEVDEEE